MEKKKEEDIRPMEGLVSISIAILIWAELSFELNLNGLLVIRQIDNTSPEGN